MFYVTNVWVFFFLFFCKQSPGVKKVPLTLSLLIRHVCHPCSQVLTHFYFKSSFICKGHYVVVLVERVVVVVQISFFFFETPAGETEVYF